MSDPKSPSPIDRLADFVHRQLLWLLLVCYALAALFPQAGRYLRNWRPSSQLAEEMSFTLPLCLLALLLFCAALSAKSENIRAIALRPLALVLGLVAVWLGPVLLAIGVSSLLGSQIPSGILVGLALVATMPVANSSVGWTHSARGDLAMSLGLILCSIALCPWITPNLLQLVGLSLSATEQAYCDLLVARFSGLFFIAWVILPTLLGFVCQYLLGRERVRRWASFILLTSCGSLLLLNYANAALALPEVLSDPQVSTLFTTIVLATLLSLIGMLLAVVITWLLGQTVAVQAPLLFGLSMKHTGLALVLAGTVLTDQPRAILMIVVATIVQHVVAGCAQWFMEGRAEVPAGEPQAESTT